MAEKMLITKLVRTGDRADLYGRGHRYKDMTLFALSDLADVGVDYAALEDGKETPCRFWALYTLSEKRNSKGNPYKDIVALEPAQGQTPAAPASNQDPAPILEALHTITGELRAIKAILARLTHPAPATQDPPPDAGPLATAFFGGAVAADDGDDRERFYDLVAVALADGTLHQDDVNGILVELNAFGWPGAADCAQAEMERRQTLEPRALQYRQAVISRLLELHKAPAVAAGAVAASLEPGWQWLISTDELIQAGKALKESLA